MQWDSSRPVPWSRLVRDWVIYAGLMTVVFALFFRDDLSAGTFIGLVASLPLYLAFGAALAKLGYVRKTYREVRASTPPRSSSTAQTAVTSPPRRPAPTKRTSTGPSQHRRRSKR